MAESPEKPSHFIQQIIENDLRTGKHPQIVTRFPPEPNGYLHVGHAKAICINFGLAKQYQGICHLRFDDTNPIKEEAHYAHAIEEDVRWLGYDWGTHLYHASDYYEKLYQFAVELIQNEKAYVDSLDAETIRAYRGTLQTPGQDSPYRTRSVAENLDLFQRMKAGEFKEGEHVLRAKIDMASGNMNLRDPILYRIRYAHHPRTQDTWCIYPMYDFAHPLSDAIEGITHSLCSLEFQDHRPLYDWCVDNTSVSAKPQQIEFARLNLSHTITSKRKLRQLVDEKHVSGWDDPRMPTLRGMRHRGYPAKAIRAFCEDIGVSKSNSIIDMGILEAFVRDELNQHAPRAMCVMRPLKVVIENYPEAQTENLTAACHPQDETQGSRTLPFTRELYIEQDDFMEDPPKKYFRLSPGQEVRLRSAYIIKCERVIKDPTTNEVVELRCTYDPDTLGKKPEGRKVKGVIHWVSATYGKPAQLRLYDRLFLIENPAAEDQFLEHINPHSLDVVTQCWAEPALALAPAGSRFQFERIGYFTVDRDSSEKECVFNQIVSLRSTWENP